jgi:hypothetical protein
MKFLKAVTGKVCIRCQEHPAKFRFRGQVKRDKDHTLCPRCYRSLADRCHAQRVATEGPSRVFTYESTASFFRQTLEQPAVGKRECKCSRLRVR